MQPKRPLSEIQRESLWMLVIFGPISIRDLACQMRRERQAVYRAVYQMKERGYATWLEPNHWDATCLGRRVVTQADRDSRSNTETPLFETADIGKEPA